ncbi:MAG: hypothetical protein M1126_00275 [Candidatus Thermoplasmatota archaeon]|nr:hypothetical protein [Candidatus Thermoplasmatota archaeon]
MAVSSAGLPVAVTVFAVLLKKKPFELVGKNVHDPPPPLAAMVHRDFDPTITAMLVSVSANPLPDAVTNVPIGPWLGVSVSVGVIPVNEAVATTVFWFWLGSKTASTP